MPAAPALKCTRHHVHSFHEFCHTPSEPCSCGRGPRWHVLPRRSAPLAAPVDTPVALTMRLITWNVAGRVRRIPDQVAALRSRAPDVVALQEVTMSSHGPLVEALASIGLAESAFSLSLFDLPRELVGPRR